MLTVAKNKALTAFFTKNREISERKKAYWKRQELLAEQPQEVIILPPQEKIKQEFETCDYLLRRDWFMSPEDIEDLLNNVSADVCREVYVLINEKYDSYSPRVREVLAIGEPLPYKGKMKVRDLTDEDLFEMEKQQNELKKFIRDQAWEKYKEMFFDERPHGEADKNYKKIQASIEDMKKKLEASQKKTKKYVPPNMRSKQTIDPEVKAIQDSIESLENELSNLNKLIKQLNADWEREQRYIYEKENF
jgi:hypothetical protein